MTDKNRNFILPVNFSWIIIAIGVILYFKQYLNDRSLWLDEAMISLDIIRLPMSNFLHQPLPYFQAAPLGFLVIEKIFVSLLGTSEYALRLYPFVCGLLSLGLFFKLAKKYLNVEFVAFAILTFVITPSLVYFSSEIKQYGPDVFFVLLSYVAIAGPCLKELDWDKTRKIGLLGALIIWFSYPAIFVLFGMAMALVLIALIQKNKSQCLKLGVIFLYWFISFIAYYIILLHNFLHVNDTGDFWQNGFISFADYHSWLNVLRNVLMNPVGIYDHLKIAGLFFLLGSYSFFKKDKKIFLILTVPLFFVFLACGLHLYSCKERLVLFLVPIVLLIIIKGIEMVSLKTGKWKIIVAFLLTGILFYGSFHFTIRAFMHPKGKEEIRTVISFVEKNIKQEDVLYVHHQSIPAFEYYHSARDFSFKNYVEGAGADDQPLKWVDEIDDLKKLHGFKRVWILFSHVSVKKINGMDNREYFIHFLLKAGGKMLDQFSSSGATVYLFDLSNFPETKNNNFLASSKTKKILNSSITQ